MARPKGFEPLTHALEGRLCISRANKKLYIKQRLTKLITSKTTV